MTRIRALITAILLLVLAFGSVAFADGEIRIKRAYCTDDRAFLFVEGSEPGEGETQYQIGNVLCGDLQSVGILDSGLPFRTLVMVDNSLSIPTEAREREKEVIKGLINGHAEGEQIRIATFSEGIDYLSDFSTDYRALTGVTDSIDYRDQETFLSDVLYDVLDEIKDEYTDGYTRIIIFSDGVDNKPIGVTKDELYSRLKDNPYPVYTLGVAGKNNEDELENMFALSRITNADYFLLDDVSRINGALSEDYGLQVYTAVLPDKVKTGGVQNSRLTVGEKTADTVIETPFGEDSGSEKVIPSEPEQKPSEQETLVDDVATEEAFDLLGFLFDHFIIMIILGIVLLLLVVIIIAVIVSRVRKAREVRNENRTTDYLYGSPGRTLFGESPTEILDQNDDDRTNIMFSDTGAPKITYKITLTDRNDPGKVVECELRDAVIIGRQRDVTDLTIDYDKTVGRKHCMIRCVDGHFYLQDLGSSNHTKLNGNILHDGDEIELRNGDIISLGRVEVYFSAI